MRTIRHEQGHKVLRPGQRRFAAAIALAVFVTAGARPQTAQAEANSVDSGAYDLDMLLKNPVTMQPTGVFFKQIEQYRRANGGAFKRGEMFVLFPSGDVLHGTAARKYLASPNAPVQTITYAGMPCSEYGSVALGLQALRAHRKDAVVKARQSQLFQQALHAVVKQDPSLRKPAAALDLSNPALVKALTKQAAASPSFKRQLGLLTLELNTPVVTVVNGFGVPVRNPRLQGKKGGEGAVNEAGKQNFFFGINKSNRAGKPYFKDPVDLAVANTLFRRFKAMAKQQGLDEMLAKGAAAGPKQQQQVELVVRRLLRSPSFRVLLGGSLTGHCAGSANAANTSQVLAAKVARHAKDFPAGKLFLEAMTVVGYGAVFNVAPQIGRKKFFLGDIDQFGMVNSIPSAVARDACIVSGSHMMNPSNKDSIDQRPQLRMRGTAEVFGLDPFRALAEGNQARQPANQRLFALERAALRKAERFGRLASNQLTIAGQLARDATKTQKLYPSYKTVHGKLESSAKVYAAQAEHYGALAGALAARREGNQAARRGDTKTAAAKRAEQSDKLDVARRATRSARREQESFVSRVNLGSSMLGMMGMTDMVIGMEYQGHIHGTKDEERAKQLGDAFGARARDAGKVSRVVTGQLRRTQYKAALANLQITWDMLADPARPLREMVGSFAAAYKQAKGSMTKDQRQAALKQLAALRKNVRAIERAPSRLTPQLKQQLRLAVQPARYAYEANEFAGKLMTIKEDLAKIGSPAKLQKVIDGKVAALSKLSPAKKKAAETEVRSLRAQLGQVRTARQAYLTKVKQSGEIKRDGARLNLMGKAARFALGLNALKAMRAQLPQMKVEDRVKARQQLHTAIGKMKSWRHDLQQKGLMLRRDQRIAGR